MNQPAPKTERKAPSLDPLYSLIQADLKRVDTLILDRVKSEVPLIHDIARHIVASGGKRIRPALTLISSQLCGYTGDRHIALAASVEFIHTATLLHDDVVDESKLRRGLATANELFGNKASVLVGDFLVSQAFQLMVADGNLRVLRILSDASAIISKGEVMQLMNEGNPETTVENYLQVISSKTAALFSAACELGGVVADNGEWADQLHEFGSYIGIAFQLVDDALDYTANQDTLGKTVGDDFHEGKITLPVIHAYSKSNKEEKAFWNRTLGELKQTPEDFTRALEIIAKYDAIGQTITMAEYYCQKSRDALASFPASPAKDAMLDIADFCVARAY
jgi:octaprenyl-diphosphate synthase